MPFVGEAHGNAVPGVSPKFFDQPVVQLFRPFARKKLNDFLSSTEKLGAVPPARVDRVSESRLFRSARIPAIFCQANLLNGTLTIERRQRRTCREGSWSLRANLRFLIIQQHLLCSIRSEEHTSELQSP